MILRQMMKAWPCAACDAANAVEWGWCPCRSKDAAEALIDLAHTTAEAIATMRHIDDRSRAELAGSTCDAFANALDDVGAELHIDVFMAACGVNGRTP